MTRRPVIGISSSHMPVDYFSLARYPLNYVGYDYTEGVLSAGGNPVLLGLFDPDRDADLVAQQLDMVDGLLLTGGMDVSPLAYGEQPRPELGRTLPLRDRNELALLAEARRRHLPVLAICRGIQVVNVQAGGTLYQDLAAQRGEVLQHEQRNERQQVTHSVEVQPGSLLAGIVGEGTLMVNSFHHQAVKDLGEGLTVVATAPDGVVEAAELADPRGDWFLAVQWHPEMSRSADEASQQIFDAFLAACAKGR